CALTDTLIADGDGVYHPGDHNSRLVLGLKGTMAEAELHLIRQRLTGARLHKASKGELRLLVPVGLDHDKDGNIVPTGDEASVAGWSRPMSGRCAFSAIIPATSTGTPTSRTSSVWPPTRASCRAAQEARRGRAARC